MTSKVLFLLSILILSVPAHSSLITFNDSDLISNPVTVDGLTINTTTGDGDITSITGGQFAGLHIGVNDANGTYTLNFSSLITSILIEFDALSASGGGVVETIFNFFTENGAASINYTNQAGTLFDGSTISTSVNDGQGIIEFVGAAFSSFSFTHNQDPSQNGFVIERIVVNTGDSINVPEPAMPLLVLAGLAILVGRRFKKRS